MAEQQQTSETAPATSDAKPYRRVIDLGDGAGVEVFEADEPLEFTPSQEKYIDKLVESKRHASLKIRQQEAELRKIDPIDLFVAGHPDFENDEKNGELMRMRLAELRLPVTSENLSAAYEHLKQSGLLTLRGEEVQPNVTGRTEQPVQTEQPRAETSQRITKRTSGITTHNRAAAVPVPTEPSEADAYRMPMEDLRRLANKQLGAH